MFAPHPLSIFALDTAKIANVAAAVSFSVGVDDLTIEPGARNAETIIVTHDRRRVHDEDNQFAFARFSNKRDNAVIGIVKIDPLEAVVGIVLLPKRRFAFVNVIQMLDEPTQAIMLRKIEKMPIKRRVVIPFAPLAEFAAHEK